MGKLLGLLHEGTIVNFAMLFQVFLRYKLHFVFALFFFFTFFTYNYYTQPVIYSVSVPVKLVATHKVSTDLSALLPVDNANELTLDELNITLSNGSFLKSLATLVIEDSGFERLNFGSTKSRKSLLGSELKTLCHQDKTCIVELLAPALRGLFYVEQGLTENRFTLVVNAIEKGTVLSLAVQLVKAIELDRIKVRQYTVQKEIKSVGNLIAESRAVMQSMGGYTALEEQEKLNNNIQDLKDRIRMLQSSSSIEIANGTSLQARLFQNKRTTREVGVSKEGYEVYLKIQSRLNEIRLNITTLGHIPEENRSATDKVIIAQLILERTRLLAALPAEQQLNSMVLDESFKDKQRENSGNFEFDYLVSKNKIAKLKADYEASKLELNEMMQNKLINESKVNGMKADLDFLKGLESKQMSLKLLNATMNSDLIFEDGNQSIAEFRKSSSIKVFLFSIAITAFLYLISILIRFSADDKIYGEDELRMYFKDLDFFGEVPKFE